MVDVVQMANVWYWGDWWSLMPTNQAKYWLTVVKNMLELCFLSMLELWFAVWALLSINHGQFIVKSFFIILLTIMATKPWWPFFTTSGMLIPSRGQSTKPDVFAACRGAPVPRQGYYSSVFQTLHKPDAQWWQLADRCHGAMKGTGCHVISAEIFGQPEKTDEVRESHCCTVLFWKLMIPQDVGKQWSISCTWNMKWYWWYPKGWSSICGELTTCTVLGSSWKDVKAGSPCWWLESHSAGGLRVMA